MRRLIDVRRGEPRPRSMRGDLEHVLQCALDVQAIIEKTYAEDAFGKLPCVVIKDIKIIHSYIWNKWEEKIEKLGSLSPDESRKLMLRACELAEPKIYELLRNEVA